MDIKEIIAQQAQRAKKASYAMMKMTTGEKNNALLIIAQEIEANRSRIIEENKKDVKAAVDKKISKAFIDRLTLDDKYIDTMIKSLHDVMALKDPVGEITDKWSRPNGMKISKMRMPLGVIGIIFESRPNVCVDASSLTIKSGNSVILRGGSDAYYSNMCLGAIIKEALKKASMPDGTVEMIDSKDREAVGIMLKLKDSIDVIIPRGGKGLVDFVSANSIIPVIYHDAGICHTYVHSKADMNMAVKIGINAKTQRPSTCNAMETLLVDEEIGQKFFPLIAAALKKANVEVRADKASIKYFENAKEATEQDFRTEYNDLILNVKTVAGLDAAIEHINTYSSHHSDAIITGDKKAADRFLKEVDSAACFVNASTRLNDGFEFGLGAEMGISNQKLHARGPVALKELTSEKYIVKGSGQIRG
jgi:glutamate-5-semialdehyde dehydrogenase